MNRRNFLKAILIAGTAPAIVKADNLMKIAEPKIIVPEQNIHTHCDLYKFIREDWENEEVQLHNFDHSTDQIIHLENGWSITEDGAEAIRNGGWIRIENDSGTYDRYKYESYWDGKFRNIQRS